MHITHALAQTHSSSHNLYMLAHSCTRTHTHTLHNTPQDPIHPEYVLQAPFEVFSFQYNPANPEIIAAGCYNGQVRVHVRVRLYVCVYVPSCTTPQTQRSSQLAAIVGRCVCTCSCMCACVCMLLPVQPRKPRDHCSLLLLWAGACAHIRAIVSVCVFVSQSKLAYKKRKQVKYRKVELYTVLEAPDAQLT